MPKKLMKAVNDHGWRAFIALMLIVLSGSTARLAVRADEVDANTEYREAALAEKNAKQIKQLVVLAGQSYIRDQVNEARFESIATALDLEPIAVPKPMPPMAGGPPANGDTP